MAIIQGATRDGLVHPTRATKGRYGTFVRCTQQPPRGLDLEQSEARLLAQVALKILNGVGA
jgi:hypothetical protein